MTGATLVLATAFAIPLFGQLSADVTLVKIVFIGLAALTVPHMVLVDGIWKNSIGTQP